MRHRLAWLYGFNAWVFGVGTVLFWDAFCHGALLWFGGAFIPEQLGSKMDPMAPKIGHGPKAYRFTLTVPMSRVVFSMRRSSSRLKL